MPQQLFGNASQDGGGATSAQAEPEVITGPPKTSPSTRCSSSKTAWRIRMKVED
jgi:hypothetical protein